MDRLRVPVYYDFASSICYVAHRVMERLTPTLEELCVDLVWSPLDLAQIAAYRRGGAIPAESRANAARVARELSVPARIPARWLDSRALNSAAIAADELGRGASWRKRVWTALYEEGRDVADVVSLARDLEIDIAPETLLGAHDELAARTAAAVREMVTGVPTFMLGEWPFGGIQQDDTMRMVLTRFAYKTRAGGLS
jgi:predicted DsbA family dithiol-disulfide isomerase